MNIKTNTVIELTVDDVIKILEEYLLEKEGMRLDSTCFKINHSTEGMGRSERPVTVFGGVVINASPCTKAQTYEKGTEVELLESIGTGKIQEYDPDDDCYQVGGYWYSARNVRNPDGGNVL